ncbi:MAG: hypothetical protein ABUS54_05415 [Actinomycetota bacterium]
MDPERRAANERFFRRVNEGIDDVAEEVFVESQAPPQVWEFVCECARRDCTDRIPLTVAEYERIRETEQLFVVLPDHVDETIEHVVDRGTRYWLVEKDV